MREILVFGDSIACGYWDPEGGWVHLLQKELMEKGLADVRDYTAVYNLAIDGDNSTWLLERFENEIKQRVFKDSEEIILIEIGSNDCEWLSKDKKTVTSKKQFEENITKLAEIAKKYTETVVFIGFTPIDQTKVDPIPWEPTHAYRSDLNREFNDIVKKVCKEKNLQFVDLLKNLGDCFQTKLVDGVHPNSAGHEEMYQIIRQFVL